MFTDLYNAQELQSDFDKEDFKTNISKITDDNINAAFECYTKAEIIEMLCQDQVWFKLDDRQLSRDCIESMLSQHNDIMLDIIRGDNAAADIEKHIELFATKEVEEIVADYGVSCGS